MYTLPKKMIRSTVFSILYSWVLLQEFGTQ